MTQFLSFKSLLLELKRNPPPLKYSSLYYPPLKKVKNLELGLGLKVVSSSNFLGNLSKGMGTLYL